MPALEDASTLVPLLAPDQQRIDPKAAFAIREHLQLGISYKAANIFMKDELKISYSYRPEFETRWMNCCCIYLSPSQYREQIKETDPAFVDFLGKHFPDKFTCYDMNVGTRKWLTEKNFTEMSVCEVLKDGRLSEFNDAGWRQENTFSGQLCLSCCCCCCNDSENDFVGPPDVFVSHCQADSVQETCKWMAMVDSGCNGTLKLHPNGSYNKGRSLKLWVDTWSLQQCQKGAFEKSEVIALIGSIGNTVVFFNPFADTVFEEKQTKEITFCLGEMGLEYNDANGKIMNVPKNADAGKAGVEAGWFITEIDDEPYTKKLLESKKGCVTCKVHLKKPEKTTSYFYNKRSWCVLEAHASVKARNNIVVLGLEYFGNANLEWDANQCKSTNEDDEHEIQELAQDINQSLKVFMKDAVGQSRIAWFVGPNGKLCDCCSERRVIGGCERCEVRQNCYNFVGPCRWFGQYCLAFVRETGMRT